MGIAIFICGMVSGMLLLGFARVIEYFHENGGPAGAY